MYCVGIFKNPLPSISTLLSLVRGSAPTQFNTVRFPLNFETVVFNYDTQEFRRKQDIKMDFI